MTLGGESWDVLRIHLSEKVTPFLVVHPDRYAGLPSHNYRKDIRPDRARRMILPWFEVNANDQVLDEWGNTDTAPRTTSDLLSEVIHASRTNGFDIVGPFARGYIVWITAGEDRRHHAMGHLPFEVAVADMEFMLPMRLARVDHQVVSPPKV
jgi:hypothetical protein